MFPFQFPFVGEKIGIQRGGLVSSENKYMYWEKREAMESYIWRALVTLLIAQLSPTSFYSLSSMLSASNFPKHVFHPSIAGAMLLSFCFLIWMNEWTWLRGCIVKADLCCRQSKLLSSAAEIILTCPLFRVQKNTVCSIVQPRSGYGCCSFPCAPSFPTIMDDATAEDCAGLPGKARAVLQMGSTVLKVMQEKHLKAQKLPAIFIFIEYIEPLMRETRLFFSLWHKPSKL